MPDREPRMSRRDLGAITILSVGIGILYFAIKSEKSVYLKPNTNELPEMPPENLQPFIPSAEIAEEIDSDTFETITEELFSFSNKVDAGWASGLDTTPQTGLLAWKRSIPFQINSNPNLLHLRWGYRTGAQLGTFVLDSSAREIVLGRFNSRLGIPFTSLKGILLNPKDFIDNLVNSRVVNFTKDQPPRLFWPPPSGIEKMSSETVIDPQELSPVELAAFLRQAIESFNARIPIQEEIPKIELGKLV